RDRGDRRRPCRGEGDHQRAAGVHRAARGRGGDGERHRSPAVVVVMVDPAIEAAAVALLDVCKAKGLMVATAESCTGGLVAGALTDSAGSSAVVERAFVTYTNEAKQEMLGVPAEILRRHGAVTGQT